MPDDSKVLAKAMGVDRWIERELKLSYKIGKLRGKGIRREKEVLWDRAGVDQTIWLLEEMSAIISLW